MRVLVRPLYEVFNSGGVSESLKLADTAQSWVRITDTPDTNLVYFFNTHIPLFRSFLTALLDVYSQDDFFISSLDAVRLYPQHFVNFTLHFGEELPF